ncbi:CGNR zinc finger domain-containing protein [Asanoa sp. NPDC049573]|uniref:CGNR zinc finger domain-containing protein n=1 Tax=Asanoa sp. NPDC049573 TaxID=3155396 RepID=UPI00343BA661
MVAEGITDLPLVAGHPVLDLVNTVEPRGEEPPERDHLVSPHNLLVWAGRAGVVDAAEAARVGAAWSADPGKGDRALDAVRDLREMVYGVLRRGASADPLLGWWRDALGRAELVPAKAPVEVVARGDATLITDRLVLAAADLLTTLDRAALSECPLAEGGCGWLFLDHSRNHSRRWCAMADCGARAKARRLTERRRAVRSGGGTARRPGAPAPGGAAERRASGARRDT